MELKGIHVTESEPQLFTQNVLRHDIPAQHYVGSASIDRGRTQKHPFYRSVCQGATYSNDNQLPLLFRRWLRIGIVLVLCTHPRRGCVLRWQYLELHYSFRSPRDPRTRKQT